MQHFDSDYGAEVIARISRIPDGQRPRWGTLRREDLPGHFIWALRHAMGASDRIPDCSNWRLRVLVKPLVLLGVLPMPRNLHLPQALEDQGIKPIDGGSIETLQAVMDKYLHLVQADELAPAAHPFFGPLDVDGWDRLHVCHFEHHLRQFESSPAQDDAIQTKSQGGA